MSPDEVVGIRVGCRHSIAESTVDMPRLSGKNLANNGHSSYKCGSLAEPPEASTTGKKELEGASASESDFA